MDFKDWLAETISSTGDVAGFSRIAIGSSDRKWPPMITFQPCDDDKKKKKKKKKKKMDEVDQSTEPMSKYVQKAKLKIKSEPPKCERCGRPMSNKTTQNYYGHKICQSCMIDIATSH